MASCSHATAASAPIAAGSFMKTTSRASRSEEHTSELQSLRHLVCRLLLEKKNDNTDRPAADCGDQLIGFSRREIRQGGGGTAILRERRLLVGMFVLAWEGRSMCDLSILA